MLCSQNLEAVSTNRYGRECSINLCSGRSFFREPFWLVLRGKCTIPGVPKKLPHPFVNSFFPMLVKGAPAETSKGTTLDTNKPLWGLVVAFILVPSCCPKVVSSKSKVFPDAVSRCLNVVNFVICSPRPPLLPPLSRCRTGLEPSRAEVGPGFEVSLNPKGAGPC